MCAANGLHLIKGQHVEVIEWPSPLEVASASAAGSEQVCRVRVVRSTTVSSSSTPDIPSTIAASASVIIQSDISSSSSISEGLVPMSVLRQFMSLRLSKTRNSFSNDGSRHHQASGGGGGSARSSAATLASGADAGDAASDSSSLSAVPSTSGGSTQRKTSFK